MANQKKQSSEAAVREIRRRTRRKFSPEEKIQIVFEGLRGEQSVSELCRREGIAANLYTAGAKAFSKRGRSSLLAIRSGKRPATKSRICAARTAS
jgi:transposase